MAEYFGTSVESIFKTQDERFRPEGAEGVSCVIAYDVSGDGGGRWKLTIKDGACKTESLGHDGDFGDYSVKMMTDAETFVGVAIGKIDGTEAFVGGKIKVDGDIKLVMLLPRMFTKFVAQKKGVTAASLIESLPDRFRPEMSEGLDISIAYNITGDDGGKWTAFVKDGKCSVEEVLQENATVTQIVSAKDYVDLLLGKLDPMTAIGGGRLRITGDMKVAALIPKLFKKFEAPKTESGPELIVLKKTISVNMKYSTGPVMGKFLKGLIDKKIQANVCPECGRKQIPPREVCALCRCRVDDFVEVGPEGTVTMIEHVLYASPDPLSGETRETPYEVIFVLLDGCQKDETFWHQLKKEDIGIVKRGDRVRPVWAEHRTGCIDDIEYFERVD